MKGQYEIILDVILECCYSIPSDSSEILARKISNALIDNMEDLKSENNRLRNLLGKPYKRRIDLENIALKQKIDILEKKLLDNLNPEDWKNRYIKLEKCLNEKDEKIKLLIDTLKGVHENELAYNQYYGDYSDCGKEFIYRVKDALEKTGNS